MSFTTFEQADREAKKREAKRNPFASEMSMRDYFAAKAMQSLITASVTDPGKVGPVNNISEYAYSYADAMLKAREA
jgi:hypothetical protein